jgi:hypothetical protein
MAHSVSAANAQQIGVDFGDGVRHIRFNTHNAHA